ncbi:MAG: AAA family ATPase [Candidatus Moranbacteria bacterium]|nr:AAA family ATPase [Candidatus Moranbacteria bacterium]MDZ4385299.1 AAA family ATPase [Candidatus Moranbacteria bacterium]
MNKKNKLIVLGGFAGAGKTTLAEKLAADFNFSFFNPDDFNTALRNVLEKDFHEVSFMAYDTLWHILKKNIGMGATCVLDANMCNDFTWKTLDGVKKEFKHLEIIPIILECTLETHKRRIEKRGIKDKEHLNLGGDKFENILHKYEFITKLDRTDIVRVDANGSPREVYEKVLEILSLKPQL